MVRLLRIVGRLLYIGLLCGIFGLATWISFRHFLQGKTIGVPDVVGRELDEAHRLLYERGLEVEVDERLAEHDDAVGPGRVRAQQPAAGTPVRGGMSVRLAPSLGPEILVVPDLSGKPSRAAALELERAGLGLGSVTTVDLPGREGVIGQSPTAGTRVGADQRVGVLVAHDPGPPKRVVPDFVGLDLERARREIERRGFRVGTVRQEAYEGVAPGRILRQSPLAGYPVPQGWAISFVVSEAAPPDPAFVQRQTGYTPDP